MRPTSFRHLPFLIAGAAICVLAASTQPVEARSNDASDLLARRLFSSASLPNDTVLDALQAPAPPPQLPEGKGKDLALKYCTTCHASTVWASQHHSSEQWTSLIDNMVSKGLNAPDEDLATITDYLTANFGPTKPAASAASPSAR